MKKENWFFAGFACGVIIMMAVVAYTCFSSPPPELESQAVSPDCPSPEALTLISTLDLQRELNRRYPDVKLVEDGIYGPATKAAHERALGDQYALELWPEDEK